jgi:hypothetical protein
MRFLMIVSVATLLFLPAGSPANACGAKYSAQAVSTELSAEEKKPMKKKVAKVKKAKVKKEKVEYMRAAPMK